MEKESFSVLLAICAGNSAVTGEFPAQRPVTRSFDILFDLRLNERLGKQSWGCWFWTPSCPLWRHSNGDQCLSSIWLHINLKKSLGYTYFVHWCQQLWVQNFLLDTWPSPEFPCTWFKQLMTISMHFGNWYFDWFRIIWPIPMLLSQA